MRKGLPIALVALALTTPGMAHDFWLDLSRYRQQSGTPIPIRFLIGDVGAVEPWEVLWRKVVSLRSYGPGGVTDHQQDLRTTSSAGEGGALVTLSGEGTHVLAFESYQAENDIPAAEFNAYAEHEGLTPALEQRRRDGTTRQRGRELYSRRSKALIQVGRRIDNTPTRVIGQTLEIVPERNPHALAAAAPLPVRIFYRGRPLAGASVVMERLDGKGRHGDPTITDRNGRVALPLAKVGRWRVGVVWTQPITHPRAEFDTVFSTMTFGF